MNKTALKTFATNARRELLKKVEARAMKIGITEDNIKKVDIESSDAIFIDGRQLSKEEKIQRDKLIDRIGQIGFKRVMEEVAYTWFNRFTALRFMEVNDYLPTKVRVLSSTNVDSTEPDMMKEALSLELDLDKEYIYELKINNNSEELFKYLIIKHCNDLNRYMPFMFETIDDYTEILFPEGLLATDSFVRQMTNTEIIPEDNWSKVEVIGWLYQYYIAEEKDRVIKAKKKYKTEEIPFATQLFTPNWIVRYMVQNSLGRYWIESHPEHRDLLENWEFYLENANPGLDVDDNLAPFINKELKVEEIKCFDPSMGSGHILVYMFDVFYEIYSKSGYIEREIPRLIIENNLYGLDIDDRAYQLACFSVVMKALQYNRRFLRSIERDGLILNLASIQETNILTNEDIAYIAGENIGKKYDDTKEFIKQFIDGKTIGSLVNVDHFPQDFLYERLTFIQNNPASDLFEEGMREKALLLLPNLIKQAKLLYQKYSCTITNPPYIGYKFLNEKLKKFIDENYPNYGTDLFSVFIKFVQSCTEDYGQIGLVTPYAWMFIKNYEILRTDLIRDRTISSLIQLEPNAFETAAVPVCTFTLRNYSVNVPGEYIRLHDFKGINIQEIKVKEAIQNSNVSYRYTVSDKVFVEIPGKRFAYWISKRFRRLFIESEILDNVIEISGSQNITGNNKKYLRNFWEVELQKIKEKRWSLYSKGGDYRKWFGNIELVVDWSEAGRAFYKNNPTSNLLDKQYWHREGITYNGVSLRGFTVRWVSNVIYDKGGPTLHVNDEELQYYILALLNTKIASTVISIFNPTPNTQVNDIKYIPFIPTEDKDLKSRIVSLAKNSIKIAKKDWDEFENSIDFEVSPLLKYKTETGLIKDSFDEWKAVKKQDFLQLKENEESLNKLFIDIYNLSEDFTPDVDDEDIILHTPDLERDIRNFISYAVGCILGRYSIDIPGVVYAGGQFDLSKYKSFPVSNDGIVPVFQDNHFDNDIVTRFVEFVRVTFGESNLNENLDFITNALGRTERETPKERLGKYFTTEFYNDHIGIFNTRGRRTPIYWLFSSGKQKAFNSLVYIHRYDKTTLSRMRTDYLHEYQIRLEAERKNHINVIEGDSTAKEISNAKKELKLLDKKIEELKEYDEKLHHMADMQIEMDLDDGVIANYEIFKGLVAKI
ncbi:BREX-1 system adenine-specific DNA-methyltransferase PglX [Cytobacillus sp. Sa5YUA1]|uniref:site-specific DNA-methyltransferase (adenine-specific) n=1 Tax=Cytobacillus stercorigallinarum TaxID=2762240 RepID=A0ABR8QPY4_9BACI|nr:BREX-1 system adenine-specific DNA-methyltransferase PglX [Cytobacillus stercorigallinarum]MBD7937606.1 BREX-1 system adenine-specific DNA-methyltransferase PglX [Cytobacillus stercorigallinarum]